MKNILREEGSVFLLLRAIHRSSSANLMEYTVLGLWKKTLSWTYLWDCKEVTNVPYPEALLENTSLWIDLPEEVVNFIYTTCICNDWYFAIIKSPWDKNRLVVFGV